MLKGIKFGLIRCDIIYYKLIHKEYSNKKRRLIFSIIQMFIYLYTHRHVLLEYSFVKITKRSLISDLITTKSQVSIKSKLKRYRNFKLILKGLSLTPTWLSQVIR